MAESFIELEALKVIENLNGEIAHLRSLLADARKVKGLVWEENRYGDWSAESSFGTLRVVDQSRLVEKTDHSEPIDSDWRFQYCVCEYYDEGDEIVDNAEAGKRRAWEWLLSRLEPGLERVEVT